MFSRFKALAKRAASLLAEAAKEAFAGFISFLRAPSFEQKIVLAAIATTALTQSFMLVGILKTIWILAIVFVLYSVPFVIGYPIGYFFGPDPEDQ